MKRILIPIVLICLLLVSCVSSEPKLKKYSDKDLISGKIVIQIDQDPKTVSLSGYGYMFGGFSLYSGTSETVKLGNIENKEAIRKTFVDKGYTILEDINESDYAVVIESTSNEDFSTVSIGFFEISSNQLLFICEGKYGSGWNVQDDLNQALLKALDAVPSLN
ncbi:MAG: hypothetical protein IK091_01970 [Spirochaetales bacterium]|nr:hypothetical protein [Spirochaetales bacterium]MBR5097980.1 hypothetical protein [Spirochaetales bacterium]